MNTWLAFGSWCCIVSCVLAAPEVVFPHLLRFRDENGFPVLTVQTSKETHRLKLQRSSVFRSNFIFRTMEDGNMVDYVPNVAEQQSKLYHDPDNLASLYVDDSNSNLKVEGLLSPHLRIRPLTGRSGAGPLAHLVENIHDNLEERDNKVSGRTFNRSCSPFFHDSLEPPEDITPDDIIDWEENRDWDLDERASNINNSKGVVNMMVEILIVCDQAHCSKFETDADVIRYFGIFVTSMNLRYLSVPEPVTKLVLVGVIRNVNDSMEPYIKNSSLTSDYLQDNKLLEQFGAYMLNKHSDLNFDLALLVTGKDLASLEDGQVNSGVAGLAWVGTACVRKYRYAESEDVATTYRGVRAAAHEIGHVLGAPHDGRPTPKSMPGSPGSKSCSWEDGYMMSYTTNGENSCKFSSCSIAQFAFYRNMTRGACLKRQDGIPLPVPPGLPGKNVSIKSYCQKQDPENKSVWVPKDPEVLRQCVIYCCGIPNEQGMASCEVHEALDGHYCDVGKVCINKVCVPEV